MGWFVQGPVTAKDVSGLYWKSWLKKHIKKLEKPSPPRECCCLFYSSRAVDVAVVLSAFSSFHRSCWRQSVCHFSHGSSFCYRYVALKVLLVPRPFGAGFVQKACWLILGFWWRGRHCFLPLSLTFIEHTESKRRAELCGGSCFQWWRVPLGRRSGNSYRRQAWSRRKRFLITWPSLIQPVWTRERRPGAKKQNVISGRAGNHLFESLVVFIPTSLWMVRIHFFCSLLLLWAFCFLLLFLIFVLNVAYLRVCLIKSKSIKIDMIAFESYIKKVLKMIRGHHSFHWESIILRWSIKGSCLTLKRWGAGSWIRMVWYSIKSKTSKNVIKP